MRECVAVAETAPPSVSLRQELEALRRAAEQRRWREFIDSLPTMTKSILRSAEIVDSDWYRLSEADQDLMLLCKDDLEAILNSPPPEPRFRDWIKRLLMQSNEAEQQGLRRLDAAIGTFVGAVDRVLRNEARARALLHDTIANNAEVQAQIARGTAEAKEGLGETYNTLEGFQARFI